jgi:hypothetical protein
VAVVEHACSDALSSALRPAETAEPVVLPARNARPPRRPENFHAHYGQALPKLDRRRALELVAGCGAEGNGFAIRDMVELIRAGLATATAERVVAVRHLRRVNRAESITMAPSGTSDG